MLPTHLGKLTWEDIDLESTHFDIIQYCEAVLEHQDLAIMIKK